ncbi:HNH endonuclease signature motif containing protein [Nocardioides sp.]|uniref:HNH endonuclease signature motif containing protein n=1 Tax=Nocardioides sp. TaxID=35761 RepID=UPI002F422055
MAIAATSSPTGVEDLDPAGVLACAGEAETAERRAGLGKLELALQWCGLHPATRESAAAVWGDAGLPGLSDCEESLGGDGCPTVAAYAPEPFATALGVSTFTGMQVLADALDLAHRLPLTWRRVQALDVAPWKARRLAQATHHLSRTAARYVDAQLADRIDSCGVALIDRTVAHAAATYDPQAQAQAEQAGKQSWDVRLLHRTDGGWAGTSHLAATGDTVDLTKFYDLVCDHAAHLARLGDTDDLGLRKAKALGAIADHQSQLDLHASGPDQEVAVRRPSLAKTRVYLHLTLTDLLDLPDGLVAAGEVEGLGPATTAKINEWLGATRVTIVPVLDLERDDAVNEHDPPEWMRETVILRDRHCVFPWCGVGARSCDLDHIEPYVPVDDGGPPGQTSPSKLACLCRRHHNAKTTGRWRYLRNCDGSYTWHGPHRLAYAVTPLSTSRLPRA